MNPATGKSQLALINEAKEIQIGRQAQGEIVREMGLYPDDGLQAYIQSLGNKLAAVSERPDLPWSFQLVDDPIVNAFALPGGFIFITRGMLAHASSEAELVGVIGHEIGHVTARHSVEKISRSQLASIGLGVAMIASDEIRHYGALASTGLGLVFLKFGRDDERQSDELGLRYLVAAGYDPDEMAKVFATLDRLGEVEGRRGVPTWLSTHPDPGDRALTISRRAAALPATARDGRINRESYLHRLDGLAYGTNPREGYGIGNAFYHPDLTFQVVFPRGWNIVNETSAVGATSPRDDAIMMLTLAEGSSDQAARRFFDQESVVSGPRWRGFRNFRTQPSAGKTQLRGLVGFIEHQGRVYRFVGYTAPGDWSEHEREIRSSLASFGKIKDHRFLDVAAQSIEIVQLDSAMTLAELDRRLPSTISLDHLAVLNGVDENERLAAGTFVKRVVGGRLPDE